MQLVVLLAMAMAAAVAACTTQGEAPPTTATTTIEATTTTTTTTIVDNLEVIDVADIVVNAAVLEMVDVIWLGWGDGVGEVGESADFGPCCFDVLPDGRIVLVDVQNGRILLQSGSSWSVLMEFDYSGDAKPPAKPPDGIAALNSGLVAVATVTDRELSDVVGTATVYIVDPDTGEIVDRGLALTFANDDWFGEDHVWVRHAGPGFQSWVQVTSGDRLIPYDDQTVMAEYHDNDKGITITEVRRRGYANPPDFQLDVTLGGKTSHWLLTDSERMLGPLPNFFAVGDEHIVAVWSNGEQVSLAVFGEDGDLRTGRLPQGSFRQTQVSGYVRIHDGQLYVLQTYPEGVAIETYDLPD